MIVCVLKFGNSVGKSFNNNYKIVLFYVRKIMILYGERVVWFYLFNFKENGGGFGILYYFSDSYD